MAPAVVLVGVCHCTSCQKGTGTAFSIVVALPKPMLDVQGALATFTGRGDSGKATYRRFCPACGSEQPSDRTDDPDPLVGQTVGDRYEITELISVGGMGRVYRAVQQPLGRNPRIGHILLGGF